MVFKFLLKKKKKMKIKFLNILLFIVIGNVFLSCHNKIKKVSPVEITPTNKFIVFFDKLKNVGHFMPEAGYVFEIKNNKNENLVLDSVVVLDVIEHLDMLSRILVQKDNEYIYFRDSLIIPPKSKQKILLGIGEPHINIYYAKRSLSICRFDKAEFFFHTNKESIKIDKSIQPFFDMPDDRFLYFVDGELMDNKYVETKYKDFDL